MLKSVFTLIFILFICDTANALPDYSGKWFVNLNHFVSGNCSGADQLTPGADTIEVSQNRKQIVFNDGDNYYYTGQASKSGFFGTTFTQVEGVNISFKVILSKIKIDQSKANASSILAFANPTTKKSCSMRYSGRAKKVK